jgi:RNA polymerase sigma factor (sigma-70 family)
MASVRGAAAPKSGHSLAWPLFLESHSRAMLRQIRRTGVCRGDEIMDVYIRVCERLREDGCARLARFDSSRGAIAAWLAVVVRRVAIDWVRTRAGRRRHFTAIARLGALERHAFELKYWQDPPPDDYAASLSSILGRPVHADEADAALARVERALDQRQRTELCAALARTKPAVSIDRLEGDPSIPMPDQQPDPEARLLRAEVAAELSRLMTQLPDDDRQILQLKFAHGCSHREIASALGVDVSDDRVRRAAARLRALVEHRRLRYADVSIPGIHFLTTIPLRPWPGKGRVAPGGAA